MILSMTGFGRGEAERNGLQATVELTSVNGRYLETQIRLPRGFNALEPHFKGILANSFSRGKITCTLAWESGPAAMGRVTLNEQMAAMYQEVFRQIKDKMDIPGEVSVSDFVTLPDIFAYEPVEPDADLVREITEEALLEAIEALREMRRVEGEKLLADLTDAHGVPGFEDEVSKVMVDHLEAADEVTYDKLGSVIARKKGNSDKPKIMIAGHTSISVIC